MTRLGASARDPFVVSVVVLVALVVVGLASVGLAWRGAADSLVVATQLPYIVSGGLGGLGIAGFALGLLLIQARRRREAQRRLELERVIRAAAGLLAEVRPRQ